jgi:hypothetical protein
LAGISSQQPLSRLVVLDNTDELKLPGLIDQMPT